MRSIPLDAVPNGACHDDCRFPLLAALPIARSSCLPHLCPLLLRRAPPRHRSRVRHRRPLRCGIDSGHPLAAVLGRASTLIATALAPAAPAVSGWGGGGRAGRRAGSTRAHLQPCWAAPARLQRRIPCRLAPSFASSMVLCHLLASGFCTAASTALARLNRLIRCSRGLPRSCLQGVGGCRW